MRHFGVVAVRIVDRVVLAFRHVSGERLSVVVVSIGIIGIGVILQPLLNERVRASRIVRRIGERKDRFVGADGKTVDFAELRVFKLLRKPSKIFFAYFVALGSGG